MTEEMELYDQDGNLVGKGQFDPDRQTRKQFAQAVSRLIDTLRPTVRTKSMTELIDEHMERNQ